MLFFFIINYYYLYRKPLHNKVIMPIVLGNSNISYKENKNSITPYNALLFKNQRVGIGVNINSILNNSLEVNGDINILSSSTYKINNANFGYSNLDHKLLAGTNISIGADFKVNNTFILPTASSSVIGGVRVGNNLSILDGALSAPPPYTLPTASGAVIGGIRVGNNLSIDASSILSVPSYTLPIASDSVIGGVRVGNNLSILDGALSAPSPYTLPTASGAVIGGIRVGNNLSITDGVLSAPPYTPYTLPFASDAVIGGVRVGANLSIDASGILSADPPYTLPTASGAVIGGIRVGNNLSITDGLLSAPPYTPYTLPIASDAVIGGVRVGANLSIDASGILSAPPPYTLPTASGAVLGGIRVGNNLSITDGVLSAPSPYTLPTASTSVLGGIRVDGTTIAINAGVISYTGGIAQWGTSGNNIYNTNTLNVGIGTTNPQSILHILEQNDSTCSLIIQNNYGVGDSVVTFSDNSPSTHEPIGTDERYMIFTTTGINYTFTVPARGINCDILLVGGGGGGGMYGGGGGGGDVIYKTNVTLPVGNCVVFVGNGGSGGSSYYSYNDYIWGRGENGSTSSITSTNASFISLFAAGGGGGGSYNQTPGTTPTAGSVINGNYSSGGGGGGGGGGGYNSGGTGNSVSGDGGYNNGQNKGGGGGGAAGNGLNASSGSGGNGGSGLSNSIIGTVSTYGGGGGGGASRYIGTSGSGVDGGGNGSQDYIYPVAGTANSGGGGGGGGDYYSNGAAGGSGIVIIRYRIVIPGSSVIDLIRGTSSDANRDFKIGNYDGDFFVKSSINGIDSNYIKMLGANGNIYNFNNSLNWTQTSDRRIKENIEKASYDKCYENVDKLELKRFNYIKEFKTGNQDTNQLGFIAQEIKDIFPKSVFANSYNSDELNIPDMLSIETGQINYTLFGTVKKLMEINYDEEMRLKRLEDLLNIEPNTSNIEVTESVN